MKHYLKTKNGILYHGDCLNVMKYLSKKDIKFDLILTDPPYGTTNLKWDSVIPFDKMWLNINNVINDNTPICLFGGEPFSSKLRLSNLKYFKYDWHWRKNRPANINCGKIRPLKYIEDIIVFSYKKENYYPQMMKRPENGVKRVLYSNKKNEVTKIKLKDHNSEDKIFYQKRYLHDLNKVYPRDIIEIPRINNTVHPTQKPVDLYKYLIKTYTKENELILDFCAGSGTLAIACHDLNRKYIMIEKEIKYCEVIKKRLIDNNVKILSNKIKLRKR